MEKVISSSMWACDDRKMQFPEAPMKPEPTVNVVKLSKASIDGEVSKNFVRPAKMDELAYTDLPKIPLRKDSLLSDLSTLRQQFVNTVAIFPMLIRHRFPKQSPKSGLLEDAYRLVHLRTDSRTSPGGLYESLMPRACENVSDIPLIFPIADGIWELVIQGSYLDVLIKALGSTVFMDFQEPSMLPKGIVGRLAQISSVVDLDDTWVTRIYVELVEQFPWNYIMKDTAESMSIHYSTQAVVGSKVYEL
ncbi:MAG: hypothetical protein Q9200_000014 [Gallowayella weberi]